MRERISIKMSSSISNYRFWVYISETYQRKKNRRSTAKKKDKIQMMQWIWSKKGSSLLLWHQHNIWRSVFYCKFGIWPSHTWTPCTFSVWWGRWRLLVWYTPYNYLSFFTVTTKWHTLSHTPATLLCFNQNWHFLSDGQRQFKEEKIQKHNYN